MLLAEMAAPTVVESPARLRPFLKWAGGKRQLLGQLRRFVPAAFERYHEPFLGSGALFFDLFRRGQLQGHACRLTDLNADLIGCYQAVARDVGGVARALRRLAAAHERNGPAAYYRVRDELFNPRRLERPAIDDRDRYPPDLAAMFIYLNRTGYNGLFRLNGRGEFNVPAGRYARPRICDEETLRAVAEVLARPEIEIGAASFLSLDAEAAPGDFVYFDPPYVPLTTTARFTSYTPGSFSEDDQRQLRDLAVRLARRGCSVVLSNSAAPLVSTLYETRDARGAGLRVHRVAARRAINSNAARRGQVDELVITNVA